MTSIYSLVFAVVLGLAVFTPDVDAVVSALIVSARTATTLSATWTIDNPAVADAVTLSAGSQSVTISAPKNSGTVTGLTACTSYTLTVNQASSPVSTVSTTVSTRPEKPVITSATSGTDGLVTVIFASPAAAPTTACPYWGQVTLTMGTTTIVKVVRAPIGTVMFYDVPPGTYQVTAVYVTPTDVSEVSTAASVTVASYVTTTTTTAATTTATGGQYVVSFVGKLVDTAGNLAHYRTGYGVVGSPAFTTGATAACVSVREIAAANANISGAVENCYVHSFTNGSVIGDVRLALTAAKLPTMTNKTLQSTFVTLTASTAQTGALQFKPASYPVVITVTGYLNSASRFMPIFTAYLGVILSLFTVQKLITC